MGDISEGVADTLQPAKKIYKKVNRSLPSLSHYGSHTASPRYNMAALEVLTCLAL
jgi:hypothetical protein